MAATLAWCSRAHAIASSRPGVSFGIQAQAGDEPANAADDRAASERKKRAALAMLFWLMVFFVLMMVFLVAALLIARKRLKPPKAPSKTELEDLGWQLERDDKDADNDD